MTMKIRTRIRTLAMAATLVVAAVGVPALGAAAEAKDTGPGTGGRGCTVENVDDNGNTVSTSTVPEGTRVGLFYCKNGEWKFGTVVLDSRAGVLDPQGGKGPRVGVQVPVAPVGVFSPQP